MSEDPKIKAWDKIRHFHASEFDSPDSIGSGLMMNLELVVMLDMLREKVHQPLHITSGYRTKAHNLVVGKTPESAHTKGLAVDIACEDSHLRWLIIKGAIDVGFKRIEPAPRHIHLDLDFDKPQEVIFYPPK